MYNRIKKQRKQINKAVWTRGIICGLLLLTAALDFFTFAIEKKFQIFDMSMLTIWTNNILIIFIVKFAVIGGLIYLLIGIKRASDYWRFLWLMMAVYLILFQTLGAISNRQVAAANPPLDQAPSVQERAETGITISMLYAYYPIAFAMLSFLLWNLGWRNKDEKE